MRDYQPIICIKKSRRESFHHNPFKSTNFNFPGSLKSIQVRSDISAIFAELPKMLMNYKIIKIYGKNSD